MRYLFIVQGEGRGHLTQAISLSQILRDHGHEVVEVLVGKNSAREIPVFFIEKIGARVRKFDSPGFYYTKSGKKPEIARSLFTNITPKKIKKYRNSIGLVHRRIEKCQPDVVVNFYEMIAGLTNLVYREKVPFISIGHTFLLDHPDYAHRPKNEQNAVLIRINNMICSIGTTKTLALSFYPMRNYHRDRMAVLPPLIRKEVLELRPADDGYILGYMLNSGYLDELQTWHKSNKDTKIHLFWDKKDAPEDWFPAKNLHVHKVNDIKFLACMERCSGYITTAGFESICEAMYLGKPVMMIPAHIEQEINASDAAAAGAGIIGETFDVGVLKAYMADHKTDNAHFRKWVNSVEELFVKHLITIV